MDPATLALLARLAGDLGVSLIQILRALGKDGDARTLEQILRSSDAIWDHVEARGGGSSPPSP